MISTTIMYYIDSSKEGKRMRSGASIADIVKKLREIDKQVQEQKKSMKEIEEIKTILAHIKPTKKHKYTILASELNAYLG